MALSHTSYSTSEQQTDQIYNNCDLYKMKLYQQLVNAAERRSRAVPA
jgi:hypothetical protein